MYLYTVYMSVEPTHNEIRKYVVSVRVVDLLPNTLVNMSGILMKFREKVFHIIVHPYDKNRENRINNSPITHIRNIRTFKFTAGFIPYILEKSRISKNIVISD